MIKELETRKQELSKIVDGLIAKKKALFGKVDIESPMSAEEKELTKEIAAIFSEINEIIRQKNEIIRQKRELVS